MLFKVKDVFNWSLINCVYNFENILLPGMPYTSRLRSIGFIAFVWCFLAFVVVNVYDSCVISYLSVTYKKPDISTFKELATNSKMEAVTLEGSICEIDIMEGKSNDIKAIAQKLQRCQECKVHNYDKAVRMVLEGNHAAVLVR